MAFGCRFSPWKYRADPGMQDPAFSPGARLSPKYPDRVIWDWLFRQHAGPARGRRTGSCDGDWDVGLYGTAIRPIVSFPLANHIAPSGPAVMLDPYTPGLS